MKLFVNQYEESRLLLECLEFTYEVAKDIMTISERHIVETLIERVKVGMEHDLIWLEKKKR